MLNREFYHKTFTSILVDTYHGPMIELMNAYFDHVCLKGMNEEECSKRFDQLITEKIEKVRNDPKGTFEAFSKMIKDINSHSKVVSSASINYRHMCSSDQCVISKKIDDCDMFASIFASVAKRLKGHGFLFMKSQSARETHYAKLKIEDLVESSIRSGIDNIFTIMFVNEDRKSLIKNLNIDKYFPYDTHKILDLFEREGITIEHHSVASSSSSSSSSDNEEEMAAEIESESSSEEEEQKESPHEIVKLSDPEKRKQLIINI